LDRRYFLKGTAGGLVGVAAKKGLEVSAAREGLADSLKQAIGGREAGRVDIANPSEAPYDSRDGGNLRRLIERRIRASSLSI
jgi:hypothetical protein